METTKQSKALQIISGILFILAGLVFIPLLVSSVHSMGGLRNVFEWWSVYQGVSFLITPMLYIITGILVMIKKNNIPVTICIATTFLVKVFSSTIYLYQFHYIDLPIGNTFIVFSLLFVMLLFAILTAFSIIHRINPHCKILKLWFIPVTFSFPSIFAPILVFISAFVFGFMFPFTQLSYIFSTTILSISTIFYIIALSRDAKPVRQAVQSSAKTFVKGNIPVQSPPHPTFSSDIASELRKYKALLDEGLITEAEYNKKKSQILGI